MVASGPEQQGSVRHVARGRRRGVLEQEERPPGERDRSDALDRVACAVVAFGHISRYHARQGSTVMGRTELDATDKVPAPDVQSNRLLPRREIHYDMVL